MTELGKGAKTIQQGGKKGQMTFFISDDMVV